MDSLVCDTINDNSVYQYQRQSNAAKNTVPPYQDRAKNISPYELQNPAPSGRADGNETKLAKITAMLHGNCSSYGG